MTDKTKFRSSTTRRELLRTGAVLATGCSIFSARRVLAQAAAFAGRPPLNRDSLQRLFSGPPGESYRALLREAARDPMAFLEGQFTLANNQRADLLELFGQAGSIQTPGSVTSSPSGPKVSGPTAQEKQKQLEKEAEEKKKQLKDLPDELKGAADHNRQVLIDCFGPAPSKHMQLSVKGGNSNAAPLPAPAIPTPTPASPRARTSQRAAPGTMSQPEQFTGTLTIAVWGF